MIFENCKRSDDVIHLLEIRGLLRPKESFFNAVRRLKYNPEKAKLLNEGLYVYGILIQNEFEEINN